MLWLSPSLTIIQDATYSIGSIILFLLNIVFVYYLWISIKKKYNASHVQVITLFIIPGVSMGDSIGRIWYLCQSINGDGMMRIGMGYDVHQLVDGRPLIVGGVQIDHQKGLLGHSDADVLTHAIADAMLGALALGSIGDWFPDTDQQYKDANSIELLKKVHSKVKQHGHNVVNIDSVIYCSRAQI